MKMIKELISKLRKDLLILFFFALLIIFLIDFYLIEIPEIFKGGAKFGQVIYNICLSFISAFIFYFIVVHYKDYTDKKNLKSYLDKKINLIIGNGQGLLTELKKSSKIELKKEFPSESELQVICSKINPNSQAPLLINKAVKANWIQYFEYYNTRSKNDIKKIFTQMPFLDSQLVKILAEIEDSTFFYLPSLIIPTMPIRNENLSIFANPLDEYYKLLTELEEYYEKEIKL